MRLAGAGCPVDRLKTHQTHQTTRPATADAHALVAQMMDDLTGAVERMLQKQLIDAPYPRQGLRALALGRVNRARSARSTANGIDDSSSVPGPGASPSPGARPGSSTGPSGQKIPLHRQFADPGVKLTNLAFMISPPAFHTVREHLAKPFHRLALPCAHLVRMSPVLRGNLLQRPIAPKRFQRDLRFQVRAGYLAGSRESGNRSGSKGWETAWAAQDRR